MPSRTVEWLVLEAVLIVVSSDHVDRPFARHGLALWTASTCAVQCTARWRVHSQRKEILRLGVIGYIALSNKVPAQVSQRSSTKEEGSGKNDIE